MCENLFQQILTDICENLIWPNIHRYLWESVCTFDRASYTANTNMHPLANIAQTDSKHWLFCTSVISERTSNYDSHAENWPSCYEISKHPVDMHIKCISICCWHFKQILATKTKRTKIINKISKRPTNECIFVNAKSGEWGRQFCFSSLLDFSVFDQILHMNEIFVSCF